MTDEQCNKFLELLMGDDYTPDGSGSDIIENPLPVILWLYSNMRGVYEDYCDWWFKQPRDTSLGQDVLAIFNLRNLVTYLVEHPEWAYTDCPQFDWDGVDGCTNFDASCACESSKIIHPALEYARGLK